MVKLATKAGKYTPGASYILHTIGQVTLDAEGKFEVEDQATADLLVESCQGIYLDGQVPGVDKPLTAEDVKDGSLASQLSGFTFRQLQEKATELTEAGMIEKGDWSTLRKAELIAFLTKQLS